MRTNLYLLFLLLFSTVSQLTGQSPFFRSYELKDPVWGAAFTIVYQDADRQLYFGSETGLYSFNGLEFLPVPLEDSMDVEVTAIFQDSKRRFWVGLKDGRIYQGRLGNLKPYVFSASANDNMAITGFVEDKQGQIWIATYGAGLWMDDGQSQYAFGEDDGLYGPDLYDICLDPENRVWLATDGGINICQWEKESLKVELLNGNSNLPDDIVRTFCPDSKGNIWIGTYEGGVCLYDHQLKKIRNPINDWDHGIVHSLSIVEGRELWIGTESSGLWRYILEEDRVLPIEGPEGLERAKIHDLFMDKEGNIWVLSNNNGLLSANRQFEQLDIPFENTQALLFDSKEHLWVGNQQGLFRLNDQHLDFIPVFDREINVISIYEDHYGVIWVGTFGEGLILYDPVSNLKKQFSESDGLANGSILSIGGKEDRVWLATLGGVSEIDNRRNLLEKDQLDIFNFDHESGLGTNFIYQTFIDSQGRVWFATDGQGLCLLENGGITCYGQAIVDGDTLPIRNVYSITEDQHGGIWFSTPKQGIFCLGENGFVHLNRKAGIRDLAITGLVTDKSGNILIIHDSGIDLLDPVDKHLIYFDDEVGITDFNPNLNAFSKTNAGDIWIADENSLLRYTSMEENLAIHPMTKITSVLASFEEVPFDSIRNFDHTQNHIVINYAGLWYTDPKVVRYRYQLEGFDDGWIYTKDQSVTYSSLPPGDYMFKVMSTENEAFENEPIKSYAFTIQKPFWSTWWFNVLMLILIFGGLYTVIQIRDKRKQRITQLQRDRIQSQLDALKSQINPHFLFNSFNTLIAIIEDDSEKAVQYVEIMSDFYRSILQYREQEVISLEEEIKLVKDYLFLLKMRYGDNLQMELNTNGSKAFLAPLTLQILVENAVKHNVISKSRPLQIRINKEEQFIVVENNSQPKLRAEKSTGFGLNSLKAQYYKLAGKSIIIENDNKHFVVKVPILSEEGT
ncbi:MAG: hypothetical protein GYB31_10625 [Bacteroidetes bacterium]|nr:hypothetical protein [Bacteroidota bacterium]